MLGTIQDVLVDEWKIDEALESKAEPAPNSKLIARLEFVLVADEQINVVV